MQTKTKRKGWRITSAQAEFCLQCVRRVCALGASHSFASTHKKPTQAPLRLYALGLANARQKGTRVPHRPRLFLTARSQGLYALGVNSDNSSALYKHELSKTTTSLHFATSMRKGLWWKRGTVGRRTGKTIHAGAHDVLNLCQERMQVLYFKIRKKAVKNDDNPALLQECDQDAKLRGETPAQAQRFLRAEIVPKGMLGMPFKNTGLGHGERICKIMQRS